MSRNINARGEITREKILKAGVKMWKESNVPITANSISRRMGITAPAVYYHFPYGIKDAVAEYALEKKDVYVVAQLIVTSHPLVRDLSPSERMDYLVKASEVQ